MSAGAVIAKILASLASNENGRKKIIYIVCGVLIFLVSGFLVFLGILGGLFDLIYGAVKDTAVNQSWNDMRKYIDNAVSDVGKLITKDIKKEVYEFMPNFSINLSKSVLQQTFTDGNYSFLLLYDTAEVEKAAAEITKLVNKLRTIGELRNQVLLDRITKDTEFNEMTISDLLDDEIFMNDKENSEISEYSENIRSLIYAVVKNSMPNYGYEYEDIVVDGRVGKKQTLTVVDGDKTEIVEYICYGEGDIYLPKFIAMQNASILQEVEAAAESDTDAVNSEIENAVGSLQSGDDEKGTAASKGDFTIALIDLGKAADIGKVFEKAVQDEKIGAKTYIEESETERKITIELETPTAEEWYSLFEIDEETAAFAKETEEMIENILKGAGITNMYLSIDGLAQSALFTYFQGFFNLPVDSDDLKENTNGILTTYGDKERIHKHGDKTMTETYERGITLMLNDYGDRDTDRIEVKANLLPTAGSCIDLDEALIYDIYDANATNREVSEDLFSPTYNYSAVTIAYKIDVELFRIEYGFDFPMIVSNNGDVYDWSDESIITMFVEYSCLDALCTDNLTEDDRGKGLSERYDTDEIEEGITIGYANLGRFNEKKDSGKLSALWHHDYGNKDNYVPHLSFKVAFFGGNAILPNNLTNDYSEGLSTKLTGKNSKMFVAVNPLLWFKGYRTDINSDIFDTLSPIICS